MPTFFARRYFRRIDGIGPTEKVAGAVILLLVAAVVVAFVVLAFGQGENLFAVDEAAYQTRQGPREAAVAGQMLPPLEAAGWVSAGEVEVLPAGDPAPAGGGDAGDWLEFGVQWVYRRGYRASEQASQGLVVLICDAATPEQAFGLCRARRPDQWEPLRAGRDGWFSDESSAAGFWKGRYYTELQWSPDARGASTALRAAAKAVAEVQLDYGGPFWAEALLPSTGRVPGTLRYVHRGALGTDWLHQVFLVDLTGSVTAWVTDAGSSSGARAIVDNFKASDEAPGQTTGEYEYAEPAAEAAAAAARLEGPLTVVPWGAGEMAVFAVGSYVHGAFGTDTDAVLAAAMDAHAVAARDATGAVPAPAGADEAESGSPFPEPGVEGWRAPAKVDRFSPDNLYVKINGRADAYLQFGVVGLTFGTYFHETDADRAIDVYWYDMGKAVNAFGIYRAEAPPGADKVDVGRDGYQAGGAVFFQQANSYVQVLPIGPDPGDGDVSLEIARRIAAECEDAGGELWAADVLPAAGRIEGSFAYQARDAFGLDFLGDVFTADYQVDGRRITLFIHRAGDRASAEALLDEYVAFFEKYGEVIWTDADESRRMVAGKVAGLIDVVFAKGGYLGGATGADDLEAATKAAAAFHEELAAP